MTALIIAVYLIGCVVAYYMSKHNVMDMHGEWTVIDITFNIIYSFGSWISVLIELVIFYIWNKIKHLPPR